MSIILGGRSKQACKREINKDRKVIKCSFIALRIRKQFLWYHSSQHFLPMKKSIYSDRIIEVSVSNNYWRRWLKVQKIGDGEEPWEKKYSGDFNMFSLCTEPYFQKKTHTHQGSFLDDSMATDKHKLTIWANWIKRSGRSGAPSQVFPTSVRRF